MSTGKTIRIVQALRERFPAFSITQAEKLIRSGKVLVGGKAGRINDRVASNAEIRLVDVATELKPNPEIACRLLKQTDDFLFLDKPSGTHSVALDFDETDSVANWLISVDPAQKTLDPLEAGLVHRLDYETSGVMIAARHAKAKNFLEQNFRRHLIRKEYVCVVDAPPSPGRYTAYASPHKKSDKRIFICEDQPTTPSAQFKAVQTEVLAALPAASGHFVRVNLITGYRHQIRAHLALLGCPIRGDKIYGGAPAERLQLHACRLEVTDQNGEKIVVESESPLSR